jgi:3'(2'), 5'-bisphosphate nucleotidase/myo-inositol-1(or 4)-monophosphatase
MMRELANIVYDVGTLLLKWRNAEIFEGTWEGSQFKARVDQMAHMAIKNRLEDITPQIPIISEEDPTTNVRNRPDYYWLIDPIDGTASFIGGFPGFVTQVALIKDSSPLMVAVYAPILGSLYLAERGQGATLNGQPLHLSSNREPLILIDNYPEPRGVTRAAYEDLKFFRYIECGSISLKICKVADGAADVFFKNVVIKDWDLAAPHLVLEEAGGVLRDINGKIITYEGNYEHNGVVAVASQEVCTRVVSWYKSFKKRGMG